MLISKIIAKRRRYPLAYQTDTELVLETADGRELTVYLPEAVTESLSDQLWVLTRTENPVPEGCCSDEWSTPSYTIPTHH